MQMKHQTQRALPLREGKLTPYIRPGWKRLPGSNALAYYVNYSTNSFITSAIDDRFSNSVKMTRPAVHDVIKTCGAIS